MRTDSPANKNAGIDRQQHTCLPWPVLDVPECVQYLPKKHKYSLACGLCCAQVVLTHPSTYSAALLESITTACLEGGLLEKAGSLYEQQQRWADARTVYRQ